MILSQYRNQAYQTPTPQENSLGPPPLQPSPKRKRADSERAVTPLQIDTAQQHYGLESESDTVLDSPRTKVAERLSYLDIKPPSPQVVVSSLETSNAPRKRLKQQPPPPFDQEVSSYAVGGASLMTPESHQAVFSRSTTPLEIEETPDCSLGAASLSSSPLDPAHSVRQALGSASTEGTKTSPRKRLASPPPVPAPAPDVSPLPKRKDASDNILTSSPSSQDSLPFDPTSLTWQEEEITGHDIDATSGDDDGLGINGIGFKPTPAIAYARSQKRRQQISEWRAREAREARQKRIERRRGAGGGGLNEDAGGVRRTVRFEEVG
ncbi:hypothetical protein B0A50_06020 [Salinomyces thailandicus]|uniref:Uncharacterized protein n=1 Tax=Salinomyces thailandicus TaxID=706561 RepID=A0A4U0TQS8_9PEZI|nr:hypothetical protein B0A50_06020 [Salinomyces thailandica]